MVERTAATNHADIITLRDLMKSEIKRVEDAIVASERLDISRHEAIDAKLQAAENVLEHRLEGLNELRGDVITKGECRAERAPLAVELDILRQWKAEQRGKASMTSVIGAYILAILSMLVGLVGVILEFVK